MELGKHLASLNLFVEADGKFFVTVAGGDTSGIVSEAKRVGIPQDGRWPADMALGLVARAENIPTDN